jgi:hypothetical protein
MTARLCPVCGGSTALLDNDTFERCLHCGTVFNLAYAPGGYSDSYFTTEYRMQYGRSYEDDFPSLYTQAAKRMKRILRHAPGRLNAALDLGAALGFFLRAAGELGIRDLHAVEVSRYACRYMRKNYPAFTVHQTAFKDFTPPRRYDLVTAWYFIEHTRHIPETVAAVGGMMNPGGIFAFSVPSAFGPSFGFSRETWYRNHPTDHSADLTPRGIRKLLKRNGFHAIRVVPASYHPDRALSRSSFFFRAFAPLYRVFARMIAYGDTIEVYARKR